MKGKNWSLQCKVFLSTDHRKTGNRVFIGWPRLCAVLGLVTQSCPTLSDPVDCSPPGSSVHGILQARVLEWVAMPSSRGSSQPRDRTQVSHTAGGFFIIWATRETLENWVGSLSLLQRIFLTQELNWGLLHCRWILYQMSYQGSLFKSLLPAKKPGSIYELQMD